MHTLCNTNNINLRKMHKHRLNTHQTFIEDFSEWKEAWKNPIWKETFDAAFKEFKENSMNKGFAAICKTPEMVTQEIREVTYNVLGCINTAPQCIPRVCCSETRNEENTMDTRTEAQQAKDYLIKGMEATMWTQFEKAEETFNLRPQRPATVKELRDAIAKGWLTVDEKNDDKTEVYFWSDFVHYGDPAKKPDRAGYAAAEKQIRLDASAVKDQIVVFGPEKGLEALNAFKAKTYN